MESKTKARRECAMKDRDRSNHIKCSDETRVRGHTKAEIIKEAATRAEVYTSFFLAKESIFLMALLSVLQRYLKKKGRDGPPPLNHDMIAIM